MNRFFRTEVHALIEQGLTRAQAVAVFDAVIFLMSLEDDNGENRYSYTSEIEPVLIALISGEMTTDELPETMRRDMELAIDVYLATLTDEEKIASFEVAYGVYWDNLINEQTIEINFNGLSFVGEASLASFTIDGNHSNSFRYNETTAEETGKGEVSRALENAYKEAKFKAEKTGSSFLEKKGYSDRDIEILIEVFGECDGNQTEFKVAVEEFYSDLDRCKIDSECSFETVIDELAWAYQIYRQVLAGLFYHGRIQDIALEVDCVDDINHWPQISLEGSRKQETVIVSDEGTHSSVVSMRPYAVKLIELSAPFDENPHVRRTSGRRRKPTD